ncbi:hypothetical protein D0Y65_035492 [Glycine soja]|uniref:Uncharacterized protein n=1 Tax=Glycine soja TaxID=3848 RepID=A0A445H9U4_GLYSO|nr:hypothetical protein D0Y65_035492 [Glycine soja]
MSDSLASYIESDAILPRKGPITRTMSKRLQEDWARAAEEGPRVLMNLRISELLLSTKFRALLSLSLHSSPSSSKLLSMASYGEALKKFKWLYDEDMTKSKGKDPLEGLGGPMTRARARKAKEALQQVLSILFEYKPKFQGEKSKVVSCIMAQMEED